MEALCQGASIAAHGLLRRSCGVYRGAHLKCLPVDRLACLSKAEFLRRFATDARDERYAREGLYQARTFGPAGRRVQLVLLDTRYSHGASYAIDLIPWGSTT